jgi:hypothetical protein
MTDQTRMELTECDGSLISVLVVSSEIDFNLV